jgi:hypothetical protein
MQLKKHFCYDQYLRIGNLECRREPASNLEADLCPHSSEVSSVLMIACLDYGLMLYVLTLNPGSS